MKVSAANRLKILFLWSICPWLVVGCSFGQTQSSQADRTRDYKVSVRSAGEKVDDFKDKLVHRVSLSRAELEQVFNARTGRIRFPFQVRKELDLKGGVKGCRVLASTQPSSLPNLGLQANDLVTAIGMQLARKEEDFWFLYRQLIKGSEGSITLERGGKPHKILYYLNGRG